MREKKDGYARISGVRRNSRKQHLRLRPTHFPKQRTKEEEKQCWRHHFFYVKTTTSFFPRGSKVKFVENEIKKEEEKKNIPYQNRVIVNFWGRKFLSFRNGTFTRKTILRNTRFERKKKKISKRHLNGGGGALTVITRKNAHFRNKRFFLQLSFPFALLNFFSSSSPFSPSLFLGGLSNNPVLNVLKHVSEWRTLQGKKTKAPFQYLPPLI